MVMRKFCAYPRRVEGYRAFATMGAAEAFATGDDEFIRGWKTGFYDAIGGAYPAVDMITEAEWREARK